jgi:hypothetical protein
MTSISAKTAPILQKGCVTVNVASGALVLPWVARPDYSPTGRSHKRKPFDKLRTPRRRPSFSTSS